VRWSYDPRLVPRARALRNQSTPGEIALWKHLKKGQVFGVDFHRQKPLDRFILDFFAPSVALNVELDGASHAGRIGEDQVRDERLRRLGVSVLRFREVEARWQTEDVVQSIRHWVQRKLAGASNTPGSGPAGLSAPPAQAQPDAGLCGQPSPNTPGSGPAGLSAPLAQAQPDAGLCGQLPPNTPGSGPAGLSAPLDRGDVGIGLGSNLGDRGEELRQAFALLQEIDPGARFSSIYESTPVDCPPGSGLFLNAVALIRREGSLLRLLDQFQAYELERGRACVRPVNAPRPIDLDLLFAGDEVLSTPRLILPHPRLHGRLFVLLPLAELLPDFVLPGGGVGIQDLIRAAQSRPGAESCRKID